jgi:signal transduction histidine kinase
MLGGGRKSEVTIQDMRAQLEGHILSGDEEQALTNQNDDDTASASTQNSMRAFKNYSSKILVVLILVLGLLTSGAFLGIGISGAIDQIKDDFNRRALDTTNQIVDAFEDYVTAASLIHSRCRHNFTRADFRELYEYLIASGLKFKAVQFDPNITHDERAAAETEAREYYNKTYPHVNYQGIRGFNTDESKTLEPRTNQTFYFPIHYMEPIYGNEAAIDLDYYSSEPRTRAVNAVFENKGPSLTDRLSLVKQGSQQSRCGVSNVASYGVVLMHPGVNLTTQPDVWPKDFASIVLCIPDLLKRSIVNEGKNTDIFIHDVSDPNTNGEPVFLVAASVKTTTNGTLLIDFIEEEPFVSLADAALTHRQRIKAANREWMITCVDTEGIWDNSMLFIILGGVIILQASVALAFWVQNSDRKTKRFNEMRQRSENEKAALILSNARQATKTERELNDFIAHEVRNPVAAAMVATNFIQTEINKPEPLADKDSMTQTREDLNIIANALKFINDLLRNMLDMHRAASKQLQVNMVPTNVLHDILEPVRGMLHRRGNKIKMIVDCPENIWIMADPLRLKQVVLNLGRNSSKFVDEGFIRLQAEEVDNNVKLYVDDSGSGIPPEKCDRLFTKFQESLDLLSQGTVRRINVCTSSEDAYRFLIIYFLLI